jgi:hypothetical protein
VIDKNILKRVADWHGLQAAKAYRKRQYGLYIRHARIHDKLRRTA